MTLTLLEFRFGHLSLLLKLHHWTTFLVSVAILHTESGYLVGMLGFTLEMSTPFSCASWILLKMQLGKSLLWSVNQIVLVHTFHLRSVVECYMWWVTFKSRDVIWRDMPMASFWMLYVTLSLITFVATPYWGYKKTMQLTTAEDFDFVRPVVAQGVEDHRLDRHQAMSNGDVLHRSNR